MAGADGIEVVPLHHRKVFHHLFRTDGKAGLRIGIMAVHTMEFDLLPVQVYDLILNPDGSKPHMIRDHFLSRLNDKRI